ncbi:efflux RND transporter periplasmic adaptor subunit [Roseivivax sediminis]|uniref:RND family efflux transporter, MFP subunit n=1 Tax=Roseivivax sediminis TaxID=936889 RepID=A0A1I1WA96_9RHOB|nr:efflux RND transporter periplasmic adaptor subunit [Roseivivax sediminis]SFD92125.1 RND family efflux transporter, MFP subunit [Roseivivax sediminis]
MTHLPDSTREAPRRTEPTGGAFRSYSEAERARMRGILQDMGTRTSSAGAAPGGPSPDGPARPRRGLRRIGWAALAGAAVAGVWAFAPSPDRIVAAAETRLAALIGPAEPPADPAPAQPADPAAEPGAAAPPPPAAAPTPTLEASGKVVARREATLSSDLTGRLAELLVSEGDRIEAGDPVARLDAEAAEAQLAIASANVAAAEQERAVVAAELAAMEDDLARTRTLTERGVSSKQALSELQGQHAVLEARAASNDSRIDVQRRQLEAMRQDLDNTLIRAPFDGVITEITANVGEIVSPVSSGGYTQSGIATVVDPGSIVGEVDVNEQFLSKVRPGQPVEMTVPAWPDRTFAGSVDLITPVVDDSTAAVEVTVAFDDVPASVYPGMRLDVAFLSGPEES